MKKTLCCTLILLLSSAASATAHYDELIEMNDYEYEPEQKKDTCSAHFQWNEGTDTYTLTIVGRACPQAGASSVLKCEDPNVALCTGEVEYMACKERYGHKLGSQCLDKDDNPIPMNEVKAKLNIRLFTGAKKVALTVKTTEYNGRRTNEAAQVYKLVKKEPK